MLVFLLGERGLCETFAWLGYALDGTTLNRTVDYYLARTTMSASPWTGRGRCRSPWHRTARNGRRPRVRPGPFARERTAEKDELTGRRGKKVPTAGDRRPCRHPGHVRQAR